MPSELPNAPLWKRLCSTVYDILVLCAISLLYFAIATGIETMVLDNPPVNFQPNASNIVEQIGWILAIMGFYCFFWMRVGQTVAMKAWRLRVIPIETRPLTFKDCILRCLLSFVAFAFCGLGYLWAIVDKDKLALHDRLSGTRVVLLPKGES